MNAPDDETLSTAEPAKAQPPHTAAPPAATEVPVSTYQPGLPKKERKPLNPALAILAGASLTAISGITATVLNIRSSERLSKERDKTDVAVQQRNDLEVKIGAIQTQLDKAKELLTTAGSTVAAAVVPTPVPAPLPSIVVVFPTNPPVVAAIPPAATSITVKVTSTLPAATSLAPTTSLPGATSTNPTSTTSTSSPSITTTIGPVPTTSRPA